jgi:hypothetical protein
MNEKPKVIDISEHPKGKQHLENAIAISEELFLSGRHLEEGNDPLGALDEYQNALGINPRLQKAKDAIDRLTKELSR